MLHVCKGTKQHNETLFTLCNSVFQNCFGSRIQGTKVHVTLKNPDLIYKVFLWLYTTIAKMWMSCLDCGNISRLVSIGTMSALEYCMCSLPVSSSVPHNFKQLPLATHVLTVFRDPPLIYHLHRIYRVVVSMFRVWIPAHAVGVQLIQLLFFSIQGGW